MTRKKLKFLVEVSVGRGVGTWLKEKGWDVKSIRDIDPSLDDEIKYQNSMLDSRPRK